MKIFECDSCGNLVFFENVTCLKCGHALGFLPDVLDLSALEAESADTWKALAPVADGRSYRQCANGTGHQVCNWLAPVDDASPLCGACRLNDTIPALGAPGNRERWRKMEAAKRRMLYTILRLGLPVQGVPAEHRPGLQFQFLSDVAGETPVLTGHQNGLITMNIAEADDAERESRRVSLHEPYRTLLGHFRHEVGHYYWDRLISGTPRMARFRELFGDETRDYAAALKSHYEHGSPADWQSRCVSSYATAHPWEDWAETWAHYLHTVDTIETAASYGLTLHPRHRAAPTMNFDPGEMPDAGADFDRLMANWIPLTHALNSLNRGMGLHDLYPFVLSRAAVEKLRFVHEVARAPGGERQADCAA